MSSWNTILVKCSVLSQTSKKEKNDQSGEASLVDAGEVGII